MPALDPHHTTQSSIPEQPAAPLLYCDIVMKGGITSGVVYPLAVCELAQHYQFKNVGGASAGAIAAAATAAAELGRSKGIDSFRELAKLPSWLGKTEQGSDQSNLLALFQPQNGTKHLFNTLVAGLGEDKGKVGRVLLAALRNFATSAIFGALPGLLLGILVIASKDWLLWVWGLVCALVLMITGLLFAVVYSLIKCASQAIPQNYYGICSGYGQPLPNRHPPLTTWLAGFLDRLAGMEHPEKPLTFGDLWGTDNPTAERNINLEMITTNLTDGSPYRLPLETDIFFFDPEDFKQLFPENIVTWMLNHPYRSPADTDPQINGRTLICLPRSADLPVVVGTRMSLSFPVLLSAVPLYAIDRSRKKNQEIAQSNQVQSDQPMDMNAKRRFEATKCWFSDGGITINLPVHFFDRPLPRWPTFAINLRTFPPDYPRANDESKNSWMPETNLAGIVAPWAQFDQQPGMGSLIGFGSAILDTMQSWMDNTQLQVPGYRDRVVHVYVDKDEGGLNLNMPPQYVKRLSQRGQYAGAKLVDRFAAPHSIGWSNQRWVRYRSTMAVIEEMLKKLDQTYHHIQPGELSYAELIERDSNTPPDSYRWQSAEQRVFAQHITDTLMQIADEWNKNNQSFSQNAPKPQPELRIRPHI